MLNEPVNKKSLWKCNDCSSLDSQEHILWCPAYGHLRENKNLDIDKDLTRYFKQVLLLRDDWKVMEDDRTRHVALFLLLTVLLAIVLLAEHFYFVLFA